jgi:hypothetical protein
MKLERKMEAQQTTEQYSTVQRLTSDGIPIAVPDIAGGPCVSGLALTHPRDGVAAAHVAAHGERVCGVA